jgi:GMC oxidoreductase
MKLRVLCNFTVIFVIVLFSYSAANAQVVDAIKKAAEKTKDVTVDATKKTVEVTKDAVDKTKDVTVDAAKTTGSGAKKVGGYTVELVDNVKGQSYEGGRWLVVTTWDGTKWVSKRTWFVTKKASTATKDAIVDDDKDKQP